VAFQISEFSPRNIFCLCLFIFIFIVRGKFAIFSYYIPKRFDDENDNYDEYLINIFCVIFASVGRCIDFTVDFDSNRKNNTKFSVCRFEFRNRNKNS
jgi:hypothetical protein